MTHPLVSLLSSRKAWIAVLAIVAVVVLAALGKVQGENALDFVKWLVATWIGSVALEDAAHEKHLRILPREDAPAAPAPPPG